jgi:hypothetical protein
MAGVMVVGLLIVAVARAAAESGVDLVDHAQRRPPADHRPARRDLLLAAVHAPPS